MLDTIEKFFTNNSSVLMSTSPSEPTDICVARNQILPGVNAEVRILRREYAVEYLVFPFSCGKIPFLSLVQYTWFQDYVGYVIIVKEVSEPTNVDLLKWKMVLNRGVTPHARPSRFCSTSGCNPSIALHSFIDPPMAPLHISCSRTIVIRRGLNRFDVIFT